MKELKRKQIRTFSAEFKKEKVSAIRKWIRLYGKLGKGERIVIEKESEAKKTEDLMKRVAEPERLLGQKQVELECLKKIIF